MRCLILSDIHANLAAFEAVLADVAARGLQYDIVWCLGDLVGYGPDPNEGIALLQTLPHVCLSGNHDWAALGRIDLRTFNPDAAALAEWTREALTPQNLRFLMARPSSLAQEEFLLAHASPREPIWEYVLDVMVAEENFPCFSERYCLVGHTHMPAIFVEEGKTHAVRLSYATPGAPLTLRRDARYILNPGSVGQPRDGDPRAAYALLDTSALTWTNHRVEYPIRVTQDKMRANRFPTRMIERLDYGR
ncbi:MAG: metallophosphoesterase family protein [Thermoflexales bacterium]|jgi:diadenosine tetraphosphatase ApaH/serine/threonine PP2A family protein phosphatase|nr:metallophosphoesterase family protein [Thermoflexales bacterium]MBP8240881.1 metallophosphoesterase family protein [Thermoflexales bacterium]